MGNRNWPGILEDTDAQAVLFYVIERLAATVLEVASATKVDPDEANRLLRALEEAGLVEREQPLRESLGGLYSPTEAGLRAARQIRSWTRA